MIFFYHLPLQFYVLLLKDLLTKVHVGTVSDKIDATFSSNGVFPSPSIKVGVSNIDTTLHGGDGGGRFYFLFFLSWQNVREALILSAKRLDHKLISSLIVAF